MKKIFFALIILVLSIKIGISQETGIIIDERDGKEYKTVKIGTQVWMAQNLGFESPQSWFYENKEEYSKKHGRLYTWESALHACPEGWLLPALEEWQLLFKNLGMTDNEIELAMNFASGNISKSLLIGGESGLNIELSGHKGKKDNFSYMDSSTDIWVNKEIDQEKALRVWIAKEYDGITTTRTFKYLGCSVRCVKD